MISITSFPTVKRNGAGGLVVEGFIVAMISLSLEAFNNRFNSISCSKTKPRSSNSMSLEALDDTFKSISSKKNLFKDLLTSLRSLRRRAMDDLV